MKYSKIRKICPICGKIFLSCPSLKRIYCSNECRGESLKDKKPSNLDDLIKRTKSKRKYFPKNCVVCGKIFQPHSDKTLTCSVKCGCQIRQGKTAYKGQIKVICSFCGKEILRDKRFILKQKDFWCSNKCMAEIKRLAFTGKKNPRWIGGKEKRICIRCGKIFNQVKSNPQKFCSRECSWKGKNYNYQRIGAKIERQARDILRNQGYLVIKSGGSKGIFDLWAVNNKELRLIQVKKYKYPHKMTPKRIIHKFYKEIAEMKNLNIIGSKELWVKAKEGWFIEKL